VCVGAPGHVHVCTGASPVFGPDFKQLFENIDSRDNVPNT